MPSVYISTHVLFKSIILSLLCNIILSPFVAVVAVVAISFDSSSCTRRDCSRSCDCNTDVHIIIIIISAHTLVDCENLACLRSGSCVLCGGLAFALVCIYGDSNMWVGCGFGHDIGDDVVVSVGDICVGW